MAGKVVEATGLATGGDKGGLGKLIEAAMIEATEQAAADGISDPDKILKLKLAARERVRGEFRPAPESEAAESAGDE